MKKQILSLAVVSALAATLAPAAFAVEKTEAISGDLNVTNFFGEKTDAVELKDGDSYTFTFKNKSNGTNNYENYVLAVTGAIGDDYTGADQEIVVIRADNWGWGGGMSDFAAPDAADGNKLAFETDINWDTFESDCQAGVDVEITLSRDGDTINYDAKIGNYSDKLTAISGVALPESAYAFFTGENCDLTGITTVNNNASTGDDTTTDGGDAATTDGGDTATTDGGNDATTDGGDAATTDGGDTTTTGDTPNSTDTTAPTTDAGTANTTTGASAGLALAGLALAGAAVVVSKRK